MRVTFDYKSKKFVVLCFAWLVFAFVVIYGATKGFPKDQASNTWEYLKIGFTPFLLAVTGWYFKEDVEEKKISNGKS